MQGLECDSACYHGIFLCCACRPDVGRVVLGCGPVCVLVGFPPSSERSSLPANLILKLCLCNHTHLYVDHGSYRLATQHDSASLKVHRVHRGRLCGRRQHAGLRGRRRARLVLHRLRLPSRHLLKPMHAPQRTLTPLAALCPTRVTAELQPRATAPQPRRLAFAASPVIPVSISATAAVTQVPYSLSDSVTQSQTQHGIVCATGTAAAPTPSQPEQQQILQRSGRRHP